MKHVCLSIIFTLLIISGFFAAAQAEQKTIILATTTSTQDLGLLDVLIPIFEKKTGYFVNWKAAGINPDKEKWYQQTGLGMGQTLNVAGKRVEDMGK